MNVFLSLKGHQDIAIVIDKAGKIRGMFDATSKSQCERLHNLLLECLAEKPPQDLAAGGGDEREIELTLLLAAHPLVHVNASLNAIATVLLLVGLYSDQARPRRSAQADDAHGVRRLGRVSLACYLWYHLQVGSVRVHASGRGAIRLLRDPRVARPAGDHRAVLAIWQIYLGFRALGCCDGGLPAARETGAVGRTTAKSTSRLARWTFPIWLYVSVTGVVVYVMLYHLWPPAGQ